MAEFSKSVCVTLETNLLSDELLIEREMNDVAKHLRAPHLVLRHHFLSGLLRIFLFLKSILNNQRKVRTLHIH